MMAGVMSDEISSSMLGKKPEEALAKLSVLVVEDDSLMRSLLGRLLHDLGCGHVLEAKDGIDALAQTKSFYRQVDLIILDLSMPKMDGLGFLESVRKGISNIDRHTPVMVLTGHGDSEYVAQAATLGIHGYILKPVSIDTITQRILAALKKHREEQADAKTQKKPDR